MEKPIFSPNPAIWLALISVYVIWGSTYLAILFAIETLPPFLMAGTRFLIAGILLFIWLRLRGDPPPSLSEWRSASFIGILLLVGGNGGVVWAQQRIPSGLAALLVSTVPLWMVLIDEIHPRGIRHGGLAIGGILVGFGGVTLLINPARMVDATVDLDGVGAGVLLIASVFWAVGSLYHRGARLPASPMMGVSMEMIAGGAGLLLLAAGSGEISDFEFAAVSPKSLGAWVYLIIFGSWVGFGAYIWLLKVAPTPLVSTYAYVNPVVAILLGYFVVHEPVTPRILLAAGIILGSVALTSWNPSGSRKKSTPP